MLPLFFWSIHFSLPFFSSTFYAQTKHPADTDAHILTRKHKQREPLQRLARNQRLKLCPLCQCHHTALFCQFASWRAVRVLFLLPAFFAPAFNAWMDEFSCLDQHGIVSAIRLYIYLSVYTCILGKFLSEQDGWGWEWEKRREEKQSDER